ncbi:MAG: hypothetical protein ACREL5_08645 [Gemmatimonadales bacterium]
MRDQDPARPTPEVDPISRTILHVMLVAGGLAAPGRAVLAQHGVDTVFVVPGSHLDLGFTAPLTTVRDERIRIIDRAIDLAHADPGFVWFEEGGWTVEAWLDHYHGDPMHIAQLRTLVRQGRIGVGATLLSPYAAAFPGALHLLTMHLDRIQRELGRRPTVAVVNDVPAVPEALIDALAAAGIHYLLMGTNLSFSAPLPASVTQDPFYWQTARGNRVLVAIDPHGYTTGLTNWLLPPDCVRAMDPRHFAGTSDEQILAFGVGGQLKALTTTEPLTIIEDELDNADPSCVAHLDDAAHTWNLRQNVARLVPALPDEFFRHLEARRRDQLAVRRGEWGGEWDLLRMSEPVWSWRLRRAIAAIKPTTPADLKLAAVAVTDHNVGLGPRWIDGLPANAAEQHIADVAQLYRRVVSGLLGRAALTSVPAPLPQPRSTRWPAAWARIVGTPPGVARVRAGPAFLYPFVADTAAVANVPVGVAADDSRLLVRTVIDRALLERSLGPRYQAVIEITLRAPMSSVKLAPLDSPDAIAGRWLLGSPWQKVIAPSGVRVAGPGWAFTAHSPLLIAWTLTRDPTDPSLTRLQALAVVNAVRGVVAGGALQLPIPQMYPGEPVAPTFELELDLVR